MYVVWNIRYLFHASFSRNFIWDTYRPRVQQPVAQLLPLSTHLNNLIRWFVRPLIWVENAMNKVKENEISCVISCCYEFDLNH